MKHSFLVSFLGDWCHHDFSPLQGVLRVAVTGDTGWGVQGCLSVSAVALPALGVRGVRLPVVPAQCPSPWTDLFSCCLVQQVARTGASGCQHSFLMGKVVTFSFH